MSDSPLQQSRELIIALDQWERVCDYLTAISASLADVRTTMPGQDSLESRKSMTKFLDNEIDTIKKLRHNGDARPNRVDNPG